MVSHPWYHTLGITPLRQVIRAGRHAHTRALRSRRRRHPADHCCCHHCTEGRSSTEKRPRPSSCSFRHFASFQAFQGVSSRHMSPHDTHGVSCAIMRRRPSCRTASFLLEGGISTRARGGAAYRTHRCTMTPHHRHNISDPAVRAPAVRDPLPCLASLGLSVGTDGE